MKLNYDCIRDVLLSMEEITTLTDNCLFSTIGFYDIMDNLQKRKCNYDFKEVYYSIIKMEEAKYITTLWSNDKFRDIGDLRYYFVYDITLKGHEYLNSVRNPKVWEKIKKSAASLTLSLIPIIAEKLILKMIGL